MSESDTPVDLIAEGEVYLSFHALAVEAPGLKLIVDTCFGEGKGGPAGFANISREEREDSPPLRLDLAEPGLQVGGGGEAGHGVFAVDDDLFVARRDPVAGELVAQRRPADEHRDGDASGFEVAGVEC